LTKLESFLSVLQKDRKLIYSIFKSQNGCLVIVFSMQLKIIQ